MQENDRGPNYKFQMYTREGNDALAAVVGAVAAEAAAKPMRRTEVLDSLRSRLRLLTTAGHPEWWDTEPRWAIVDAMNFDVMVPNGFAKIEDSDEFM